MTREQLEAVLAQAKNKRTYLESKILPSQPIPKWLQNELNFIDDHEAIANALFQSKEREGKLKKTIERLTALIELFEAAFNQLMIHRPALVHFTGKVEAIQVRPMIFFQLARLLPDALNKKLALQFYHEYSSELLTGRTTRPTAGTDQINSSTNSKSAVP
ncbi:hypothetical protein [Dyadobacter psychrotolerans]|uniref:Uncharacterized protein n=1 Tax=Dyadobacter psychrotolerans TaxID=2541721 RepID=A0A4R5DNY5_9BACT|nr:hypothetical protein [Dyadobacter psychrotolerans]TDE15277.1 hypothetical protein E0F88_12195 [Dyadobacter psychrotolerans]